MIHTTTNKPYVAIDGEGLTDTSRRNEQFFTLLGSNLPGETIENYGDGIPTREALDFLLRQKELQPDGIFVSFMFSWDVNMVLADVAPQTILNLKNNGWCYLRYSDGWSYRIDYLKRKWFIVTRCIEYESNGRNAHASRTSIKIYDTWGFFQASFVKALSDWGIATKQELKQIADMKDKRATFASQNREAIRDYNTTECVMLVAMMDKLRSKLTQVGLELASWHGPGAIATTIYNKHKCKPFLPKSNHHSLLHGYFGGRIQTLQLGSFKDVFSYDIRSAYPYAQSLLPLFDNVEPEPVTELGPWDLVHVTWNTPEFVTPFPWRSDDRRVHFHKSGTGIYHSSEVQAALDCGFPVDVHKIWRIPQDNTQLPFGFINDYYHARAVFRAAGDEAHIAIKLALNSLYGKTAQKQGNYNRKKKQFIDPPWRSYMVAGAITALTRAMLLRAAMQCPDAMLMFATDGIASTTKLDLPLSANLGDWEEETHEELRIYQAGLYVYRNGGDYGKSKTRSVRPPQERKDLVAFWDRMQTAWNADGVNAKIQVAQREFITFGIASDAHAWRTWEDKDKEIQLYPTKGYPLRPDPFGNVRLLPLDAPRHLISTPYVAHLEDDPSGIL